STIFRASRLRRSSGNERGGEAKPSKAGTARHRASYGGRLAEAAYHGGDATRSRMSAGARRSRARPERRGTARVTEADSLKRRIKAAGQRAREGAGVRGGAGQ